MRTIKISSAVIKLVEYIRTHPGTEAGQLPGNMKHSLHTAEFDGFIVYRRIWKTRPGYGWFTTNPKGDK